MIRLLCILLAGVFVVPTFAQRHIKKTYTVSNEDFFNPERGFYIPTESKASVYSPLNKELLLQCKAGKWQPQSARYAAPISLVYRGYELDIFKNGPISAEMLKNMQADFDLIRSLGMKIILRFAYINKSHGGDCGDSENICPPYGDASPEIVSMHIQQLKPLLQKNYDVIAVLQAGFIGIWGENYFTDFFGDASNNGDKVIRNEHWVKRNAMLKQLLQAMPKSRMVQVRTPQIKQRFLLGPTAAVTAVGSQRNPGLSGSEWKRIGFHNDCFLASEDDYGTYMDYGNSQQPKDTANIRLRAYKQQDSRFVAVGGETCDDAFSPQNDCEPVGRAVTEMATFHYTYLNASYNNKVNNDWDSLGCMHEIKTRLGYRIALQEVEMPSRLQKGKPFKVQVAMVNLGFAAPINPRPLLLVLQNKKTGQRYSVAMKTDVQAWYPGKVLIRQNLILPGNLPLGTYNAFLHLPDADARLNANPDYSIRLANEGVWVPATGMNDLAIEVLVR